MNITDITSQDEVKPLALQCADPHVYFHTDGYYYFTYMRHRELPLAILRHCFTSYACKALCVSTFTCYCSNDVIYIASAAKVIERLCKSLAYRTDCHPSAHALADLVTDVSCVDVREDECVCLLCS